MRIGNPYLVGKMFKNISSDSVRSGRTCLANLSVRSGPVKKLICPVRLSPTCFAEPVQTGSWAVKEEQTAPYSGFLVILAKLCSQFLVF